MHVGFIGLGTMGRAMAGQLVAAGHQVTVWNRSPEPVAELVKQGARPADGIAEVLGSEVVVSMLANDAAVESLLLDEGALAAATTELHVNMATISPALAKRAAELHLKHGVGYVAAPVLGRPEVAAAGNLNILAAGPDALLDRAAPLFDAMGRHTYRLGEQPQLANVAKVSANFMLFSAVEAFAEAATLAEASGLAPADLLEVLTGSFFPGPVYSGYGSMIVAGRYEPAAFKLALALKDVNLALDTAADANVPLPLGSLLRNALLESIAHGDGERDGAAIAETARRHANLTERQL
ncbi:3-hydroxyisobutyrate dehydrogenase-like beta-hydroxyacid dehydrogenase [Kitasatospora sp. GP30]|uniref:NAD(P)-dependent oxidoreductase n=1 Tax=Kitasatospora sp. GP30 TaxID=3035084 RepID=UPI000C708F1D|nr:NAD(P)-dependent oxidoreductase [Kitasatospora sp. GP30]MDH6142917.1 3-hydroxyisobutyrate dehydrogenase-like beta-hydroxyacid dehydrogenase [Kitasatospora sp. GP30]